MILTHSEPRQEEGNPLDPGSTSTNYQPTGKISRLYMNIYNHDAQKRKENKFNVRKPKRKRAEVIWKGR